MNNIKVIGYVGLKRCYLNITKKEAIKRYCEAEDITEEEYRTDDDLLYTEIECWDEFEGQECE